MIQSGILTTIDSTTGQSTGVPVRGAWINFVQNNVTKATVQTNVETGAYSVDVPFGKYTVNLAVGNVTVTMRAGQLFELKSGDNASVFQNWLYSTTADVDDTLLNSFKQIANDISDSANRAENAATEAQQIQSAMTENGYVTTKDVKLAYLFGNPANGRYKTQDDDPAFIDLTPLNATNAYVDVLNYFTSNGNYIKLEWTYSGNQQGQRSFQILKTNGAWGAPQEIYKGSRAVGLVFTYNRPDEVAGKYTDANNYIENGIYHFSSIVAAQAVSNLPFPTAGILVTISGNNDCFQLFSVYGDNRFYKRKYYAYSKRWTEWALEYNTSNTTVDSNGNIKKASPIIKLFDNHIEWNQDFKEDPIFEKLGIGVYKISNTNGLARGIVHGDWYIETPKNRNGLPYFMVEWEQDAITDDVIIKVFDRKFDINIGDFVNGEPHDIGKDERWIDLRFHEQIYALVTNRTPRDINVPYRELWGIEPYIPPIVEPIEEDIALEDQRAF